MNIFHELQRAKLAGLPFLLIGGHAVAAHGFPRLTFDVDIVVPKNRAPEWKQWFEALGYRCFFETKGFFQLTGADGDVIPVDVMTVEENTFEKLSATSVVKMHQGMAVALPSAESIIAMKLHAIPQRDPDARPKDWMDIEGIIRANKLDVRAPAFRAMVLRYAGPGSYERLLTARAENLI